MQRAMLCYQPKRHRNAYFALTIIFDSRVQETPQHRAFSKKTTYNNSRSFETKHQRELPCLEVITHTKRQPHPHIIHRLTPHTLKHSQRLQIAHFSVIHFDKTVDNAIRFLRTHTL
jgi:hypothetical protein